MINKVWYLSISVFGLVLFLFCIYLVYTFINFPVFLNTTVTFLKEVIIFGIISIIGLFLFIYFFYLYKKEKSQSIHEENPIIK